MKLYDTKTIALILDVSERRVRQLRDEKVIKENRPGLYEFMPTVHAYINFIRDNNSDSEEHLNYKTEQALLIRAKRKNEEYDLQLKEKELHSSEDIELVITNMLINFKTKLLAIPSKLSPILSKKDDKAEIYEIIKQAIDEGLNELANFDKLFGDETDEGSD